MPETFSTPILARYHTRIENLKKALIRFVQREKFIWGLLLSRWDAKRGKGIILNSIDDLDNL